MLKHILSWLIVTLVSIVAIPGMIEPVTYIKMIKANQDALSQEIGERSTNIIITSTDEIYNSIFEDSGFHRWVIERYKVGAKKQNELETQNNVVKADNFADKYITSFFVSMYDNVFRLSQLFYWATFALPLILAAVLDGIMYRKVRIATFQYSSPAMYNTLWHLIIAVGSLTAISCNMPFNIPPIAFSIVVGVLALLIRALISNLQRSA